MRKAAVFWACRPRQRPDLWMAGLWLATERHSLIRILSTLAALLNRIA